MFALPRPRAVRQLALQTPAGPAHPARRCGRRGRRSVRRSSSAAPEPDGGFDRTVRRAHGNVGSRRRRRAAVDRIRRAHRTARSTAESLANRARLRPPVAADPVRRGRAPGSRRQIPQSAPQIGVGAKITRRLLRNDRFCLAAQSRRLHTPRGRPSRRSSRGFNPPDAGLAASSRPFPPRFDLRGRGPASQHALDRQNLPY
mgnify:CR=1 FL=1